MTKNAIKPHTKYNRDGEKGKPVSHIISTKSRFGPLISGKHFLIKPAELNLAGFIAFSCSMCEILMLGENQGYRALGRV